MSFDLLLGDCLDHMKEIPDQSIDMVLCDLPYGMTNCAWDTPIDLKKLWVQYNRICNGAIVLFAALPFDKVLACSNLPMLRYEWIYEKPNATGFLQAKIRPMKAHENILVFYKKSPTYNPLMSIGHPRKMATRRSLTPIYGKHQKITAYDSTIRYPRSVIKFSSDKQKSKLHPTQKPIALCEYLLKTYTNPGDTVLDNCMGSGTTGVAAIKNGLNFIGIESDKHYFDIACKRILEACA